MSSAPISARSTTGREPDERVRAVRRVLYPFTLTFVAARILVFLIMDGRVPDLFVHVHGTHVHHLSFGIFLMSGAFGYELFWRPTGRALATVEVVYGIALALTFDEFGMWIHLGGSYWQRASFDAVVVVAALLTLTAFAPSSREYRREHVIAAVALLLPLALFVALLLESLGAAGARLGPELQQIEQRGPR